MEPHPSQCPLLKFKIIIIFHDRWELCILRTFMSKGIEMIINWPTSITPISVSDFEVCFSLRKAKKNSECFLVTAFDSAASSAADADAWSHKIKFPRFKFRATQACRSGPPPPCKCRRDKEESTCHLAESKRWSFFAIHKIKTPTSFYNLFRSFQLLLYLDRLVLCSFHPASAI